MAKATGQTGYDQTAITNAQAYGVTPESNAITDRPATSSQTSKDKAANSCEIMSQMRMGLREGIVVSKAMLLGCDL
jgi:hypothetical protein